MSSISEKEMQDMLSGLDDNLLQKNISRMTADDLGSEGTEPAKPHYPVLVPGKYIGSVALSVEKTKKGVNVGRPKIVFELTATKGDLKGGKTWHHRVVNPTFLDRATAEEKDQHTTGILKLLSYCGVIAEEGDKWEELFVKVTNIGNNTNLVRFTLKPNPSKPEELSPYIDGSFWDEDRDNSLFNAPIGAGETLPDGRDFPV